MHCKALSSVHAVRLHMQAGKSGGARRAYTALSAGFVGFRLEPPPDGAASRLWSGG